MFQDGQCQGKSVPFFSFISMADTELHSHCQGHRAVFHPGKASCEIVKAIAQPLPGCYRGKKRLTVDVCHCHKDEWACKLLLHLLLLYARHI